jgi:hypothetical protein
MDKMGNGSIGQNGQKKNATAIKKKRLKIGTNTFLALWWQSYKKKPAAQKKKNQPKKKKKKKRL